MRWQRSMHVLVTAGLSMAGLGCSDDTTSPPAPEPATIIAIASGNPQNGIMGGPLASPIVVRVADLEGEVVPGAVVTFVVTGGGGSVGHTTVSTDASGLASTTWTLGSGPIAFRQTVMAVVTLGTGPSVTFVAAATPLIEKLNGDLQTGEVAQRLPEDPAVLVQDAMHNPVPGVAVTWSVSGGGGVVSKLTSVTDAAGEASIGWTIGPMVGVGAHSLQAVAGPSATATFSATGILTAGTVSILGGDAQSGTAGQALANSPRVVVRTPGAAGQPVAGVEVQWSVTAGGGSISDDWGGGVTNTAGVSFVDWKLGMATGPSSQALGASVPGIVGSLVTFLASATPPPPRIIKLSGDLQTGTVRTALPEPLAVVVRDADGTPLPGVPVYWSAVDPWGGYYGPDVSGSVTSAVTLTDNSGQASVGVVLPKYGYGFYPMRVALASLVQVGGGEYFSATVLAGSPTTMRIFSGDMQSALRGATLALPISVRVTDQFGNETAGITVTWAAAAGSGSTTVASSITDDSGIASTGWTIGNTVGTNNQIATATVAGLTGSPVTFTASATAGP